MGWPSRLSRGDSELHPTLDSGWLPVGLMTIMLRCGISRSFLLPQVQPDRLTPFFTIHTMVFKAPTSRPHAFLVFLSIALLTRLPYFFKADIDWDEHTFMLLGQSVLDGHLPYTFLLDNKPPFLWYSFAGLALLAQKSLFRLRLIGSLLVACLALLSYINVRHYWDPRRATIAGLTCIVFLNLGAGGQAVMSEHLALLPLAFTFTLWVSAPRTDRTFFWLGVMLAITPLIRLNLAYFSLVSGVYFLVAIFWKSREPLGDRLRQSAVLGLGIATVALALGLPYLVTGNLISLDLGMIQAALSFSREQSSLLWVFVQQMVNTFLISKDSIALLILNWFILLCLGHQGLAFLRHKPKCQVINPVPGVPVECVSDSITHQSLTLERRPETRPEISPETRHFYPLLWLGLLSIEVSILKTGVFYGHYNLQFAFFISLLMVEQIAQILDHKTPWKRLGLGFVGLVFIIHHTLQYGLVAFYWTQTGNPNYGLSFKVSAVLAQENPDRRPVWLQTYHLAYWLNHTYPVLPSLTHPSNINKAFLLQSWYGDQASPIGELQKIMAQPPRLIIGWQDNPYFFPDRSPEQALLQDFLARHYQILEGYDPDLVVYRWSSVAG